MKRWSKKGSTHAKERMSGLRVRKLHLVRDDLGQQYRERFGGEWFPEAKPFLTATHTPMDPEHRVAEHIAWLRLALTPSNKRDTP